MARRVTAEERERARRGGEWLRDERLRRGYKTGTEFAEAVGLRQGMISVYENGQKLVSVEHARRIAGVFEITEWEAWLGLQLPLPRELDDDEAIRRALELRPDVMEQVTGLKPSSASRGPRKSPGSSPRDAQTGEKRRSKGHDSESAV